MLVELFADQQEVGVTLLAPSDCAFALSSYTGEKLSTLLGSPDAAQAVRTPPLAPLPPPPPPTSNLSKYKAVY